MIYFAPGTPWIDEGNLHQAKCPIYMYGDGPWGKFVFDTTWRGGTDVAATHHAREIAVYTAMALTLMAQRDPDFAAHFIEIIEGQV